jgi:hypothetical protein
MSYQNWSICSYSKKTVNSNYSSPDEDAWKQNELKYKSLAHDPKLIGSKWYVPCHN